MTDGRDTDSEPLPDGRLVPRPVAAQLQPDELPELLNVLLGDMSLWVRAPADALLAPLLSEQYRRHGCCPESGGPGPADAMP